MHIHIDKKCIRKILIIRLSSIGDVLHASPVAQILRTQFPEAYIAWVVETKSAEVIQGNSNLDEVVLWPRKEWRAEAKRTNNFYLMLKRNGAFLRYIKDQQFDLVLDLQGMSRSALIALTSGAAYRACLSDAREMSSLFYNIVVQQGVPRTVLDKYAAIVKFLEADYSTPLQMEMPIGAEDHVYAEELIRQYNLITGQFIIFIPSTSIGVKNWPVHYFAQLGDMVVNQFGTPVVILGGPSDKENSQAIKASMESNALDLSGQLSLKQVGAFMKRAGLVVSGDTGPLYIAEAVGVPTVSLFGVTDPGYYGPRGNGHISLRANDHKLENLLPGQVFQSIETLFTACLTLSESTPLSTISLEN